MATDIIARGMASKAAGAAQKALDELARVVEGTMNAAETEFTDVEGNVVTPNTLTIYLDETNYVYYRWNGTNYYTITDPRDDVKFSEQILTTAQQTQARTNISAQETLVSGANIKTVNGESIVGAGNVNVRTSLAFDPNWPTNTTVLALAQAINADPNTGVGMEYLGEIACSDMPFSGNAEVKVEILHQVGSQKVMLFTITSSNVYPYHWEATYWSAGLTAWREMGVPCRRGNITIKTTDWVSGNNIYTYTHSIQGLDTYDYVEVVGITANDATIIDTNNITFTVSTGTLVFEADTLPASDIVFNITVINGMAL